MNVKKQFVTDSADNIIAMLDELDTLYFSNHMTEFCTLFVKYYKASSHDAQHELFRQAFIYNSELLNAEILVMIKNQ